MEFTLIHSCAVNMLLFKTLLFFCFIKLHHCTTLHLKPAEIYTKLNEYLQTIAVHYKANGKPVSIAHGNSYFANDIANKFIENVSPASYLTAKIGSVKWYVEKPPNIFFFVDAVEQIQEIMNELESDRELWSTATPLHFVVCTELTDVEWLEETAEIMWMNHYCLDFLIVYYFEGAKGVEYNPFLKEFREVNPTKDNKIFSNKLQDLYGYMLTPVMHQYPPRITEDSNGRFYGVEANFLYAFIKKLNATASIYVPISSDYYDTLINHTVDFLMVDRVAFPTLTSLKYSYPRTMDGIVVIVPSSEKLPQYQYIFLVFSFKLWISVIVSAQTISLVKYFIDRASNRNKRKGNILYCIFDTFGVLLNQPFKRFDFGNRKVKALLTIWFYAAMIVNVAFQSSLTSIMITPKYEENINTLLGVQKKESEVLINIFFRTMSLKSSDYLKDRFYVIPHDDIIKKMENGDTDKAYVLESSLANAIVNSKLSGNSPVYHIVPECLIPGYGVYLFPIKSPYLKELNKFILLEQQFGISSFNTSRILKANMHSRGDEKDVPLSIYHLQTAFYMLTIGIILSTLVFILEILCFSLNNTTAALKRGRI